jgi:adenine-specific DNA-methyltransferase
MPRRKTSASSVPNARRGSKSGPRKRARTTDPASSRADTYTHPEAKLATRPDVGTQAGFRKKKPAKNYKYDSSLSPALAWDGQNPARERGEKLIADILAANTLETAKAAAAELENLSRPFLDWSGKAERLSFDVPTLPLFVHERLSTQAILETLKRHRRDEQEMLNLFGDPQRSITDQMLRAYEHKDKWVNRLILGDSLVVMNSLLEYEGLGGKVQMIYIDPPYGVKFGSNFQPFVRKRDVKHNDDSDMTREPEMVQAYRDTWELGLHSYLTYLRDRLLVARDLLTETGSVFVQISDENLHHVREVLDEVFGSKNSMGTVSFKKTGYQASGYLPSNSDYICWYARDRSAAKYRQNYVSKWESSAFTGQDLWIELDDGSRRRMTKEEIVGTKTTPEGSKIFRHKLPEGAGASGNTESFTFEGRAFRPKAGKHWSTTVEGMQKLALSRRWIVIGNSLRYVNYFEDFPVTPITTAWADTVVSGFADPQMYVVQTATKAVQRCVLMTTDPGDLVLDPTCGSGTTAYVAEQWGRRWITIDTSRVPLALARQRILTASYPWYDLKDDTRGPAGGFVYKRKQNNRGEEVGGIVPHVTLKSIANDEPPKEEVLVDRPEIDNSITRVSGPFVVEATIPTPVDYEGDGVEDSGVVTAESYDSFVDRMLDVLRRNPKLQLGGGRSVELRNVRPPAKSMSIAAEAIVDSDALPDATLSDVIDEAEERRGDRLALSSKVVAIAFGPENGAVSEKLVFNAGKEANARNYAHLFVIGFAIQPNAREMIENAESVIGIPATYVAATPDILMGDLLKTMRSSQIFSVCGLPEIRITNAKKSDKSDPDRYTVTLLGLDTFDPVTMESVSLDRKADIPAWFLDSDYNELSFHVTQAFFPGTGAWENLRRALRGEYAESVWDHLDGLESAPFEAAPDTKVAVKVIDKRGNELMVVKTIGDGMSGT